MMLNETFRVMSFRENMPSLLVVAARMSRNANERGRTVRLDYGGAVRDADTYPVIEFHRECD